MTWEGDPEVCKGEATLEEGWQGRQLRGLLTGLDGNLQVAPPQKKVTRAVEHAGGQANKKSVGPAHDLIDEGGDNVQDDLQDCMAMYAGTKASLRKRTKRNPSPSSATTWWAVLSRYQVWTFESKVTYVLNSVQNVPRKNAFREKCSGGKFTSVGSLLAEISHFTS